MRTLALMMLGSLNFAFLNGAHAMPPPRPASPDDALWLGALPNDSELIALEEIRIFAHQSEVEITLRSAMPFTTCVFRVKPETFERRLAAGARLKTGKPEMKNEWDSRDFSVVIVSDALLALSCSKAGDRTPKEIKDSKKFYSVGALNAQLAGLRIGPAKSRIIEGP